MNATEITTKFAADVANWKSAHEGGWELRLVQVGRGTKVHFATAIVGQRATHTRCGRNANGSRKARNAEAATCEGCLKTVNDH